MNKKYVIKVSAYYDSRDSGEIYIVNESQLAFAESLKNCQVLDYSFVDMHDVHDEEYNDEVS